MLLLARRRPERVAGLVGIAAAPDFSQSIWWSMSAADQDRLAAEGVMDMNEGEASYTVTRSFVEDGRRHLILRGPLNVPGPVRLLQGMRDESVPWPTAQAIADRLVGDDVVVTLIKDGDHRLSRDEDLARLGRTLDELLSVRAA